MKVKAYGVFVIVETAGNLVKLLVKEEDTNQNLIYSTPQLAEEKASKSRHNITAVLPVFCDPREVIEEMDNGQ